MDSIMPKPGKGALAPYDLEDKIPPCPFCGGVISIETDNKTYGYDRDQEMFIFWAKCVCGMEGPRYNTSAVVDPKNCAINWAAKRYGQEHGLIVREKDFIADPEKYLARRTVTKVSVFGDLNKKLLEFPKLDV